MNKRLKKALKTYFTAPPPIGKTQFLKTLRFPKVTYRGLLLSQLRYIRKRVWLVSAMILILGWRLAFRPPEFINWDPEASKIWGISAVFPFLAMLTITEIYRFAAYRMAELEASCRFGLPQLMMARITVLGGGNFVILMPLLFIMDRISPYSMLQVITYLMVPYLIVCNICLWILNRVRGQEGVYRCTAAVCLVGMVSILFGSRAPLLYTGTYLGIWVAVFVSGCVLTGLQIYKLLKQMEERTWNLFLTE